MSLAGSAPLPRSRPRRPRKSSGGGSGPRACANSSPRPALHVLDVADAERAAGVSLWGGAGGADLIRVDQRPGHADGMIDVPLRPAVGRQVDCPAAEVELRVFGGIAIAGGTDERDLLAD